MHILPILIKYANYIIILWWFKYCLTISGHSCWSKWFRQGIGRSYTSKGDERIRYVLFKSFYACPYHTLRRISRLWIKWACVQHLIFKKKKMKRMLSIPSDALRVKEWCGHYWLGQKKKLFGCPPPPAPNFWKLEKRFTVQKYTAPNFQNSKKSFFFLWEFWSFKNIFEVVVFNLFTF